METIAAFIRNNPTAILLVAVGIALRYWVNRRRFYRRTYGGIQQFSSYGKAVFVRFAERILMLLSVVFFIAALIIFIKGH